MVTTHNVTSCSATHFTRQITNLSQNITTWHSCIYIPTLLSRFFPIFLPFIYSRTTVEKKKRFQFLEEIEDEAKHLKVIPKYIFAKWF